MAKFQPIYACAFLLALISCHGILFTEGRQMKSMTKQEFNPITDGSARETGVHGSQTIGSHHNTVGLKEYGPPTPPAHIPDDHSVAGKSVNIYPPMKPNQSLGFGRSAAVSEDDFRPTTPGNNSPGVGHRFVESTEDIEPAEANSPPNHYPQDRSTSPGHSPGVGHSFQNRIAEPNA